MFKALIEAVHDALESSQSDLMPRKLPKKGGYTPPDFIKHLEKTTPMTGRLVPGSSVQNPKYKSGQDPDTAYGQWRDRKVGDERRANYQARQKALFGGRKKR